MMRHSSGFAGIQNERFFFLLLLSENHCPQYETGPFTLWLWYFLLVDVVNLSRVFQIQVGWTHRKGSNRKRYSQSTNVDQKSIVTVISIAICRQSVDKWQSKTLFLMIFDLRSSIVLTFSDCRLSGANTKSGQCTLWLWYFLLVDVISLRVDVRLRLSVICDRDISCHIQLFIDVISL